jgi:Icc-related predicted phosphoesterase
MRLVCISDTHNQHDKLGVLPDGDVLIHAGDWTGTGTQKQVISFIRWFSSQPHKHKVLISGNHEITLDIETYQERWFMFHPRCPLPSHDIKAYVLREEGIHYLEDQSLVVEGFHFYGSPVSPSFGGWGFNVDRGKPIKAVWRKIPTNTDVLITHGPPYGYGDKLDIGERVGCPDLLHEVSNRIKPKVHIFGHIHEGYGTYDLECGTKLINASYCNEGYIPTNEPIIYDLQPHHF